MKRYSFGAFVACTALLAAMTAPYSPAQSQTTAEKETTMTQQAAGAFDVKITPQSEDKAEGAAALGRMSLDKIFHGDLDATSRGEMLTAMGAVEGSAVYVAVERVKGTLHGRKGTFALVHKGTMAHGKQQLTIDIVPDSGTEQLRGIEGSMTIRIETGGKHFYELSYTLPQS